MAHFPLFINLTNQRCLVVGGGRVAERRVAKLLEFGAWVHIISPQLTPQLQTWLQAGKVSAQCTRFEAIPAGSWALAVAATDDAPTNRQVAQQAQSQQIPISVADQPELGSFYFPAVIQHQSMVIGLSSSGQSPRKTKNLRQFLEKQLTLWAEDNDTTP